MKPFPSRLPYALALVAILVLAALLAYPRPGVRVATLKPLSLPMDDQGPRPATNALPPRIRVATYNLEHYTDGRYDGVLRTAEVAARQTAGAAEIIAEANPDILVLEEIENPAALRALNAALPIPYPYAYITRYLTSSSIPDRLNEALLSRIPPAEVRQLGFHRLPRHRRPTRGALAARFSLAPGRDLLVYGVHLKSNFGDPPRNIAQRSIALHLLAADAEAERYASYPRAALSVLILGDTNVDPENEQFAADPSFAALAGGYTDLWLGVPLPARTTIPTRHAGPNGDTNLVFPPSAFDRIFASKDLTSPPAPYAPPPNLPPPAPDDPAAANRFPHAPPPSYAISLPVSIQRGCATHDNLLQPGMGGHVSDHYLAYADITPVP